MKKIYKIINLDCAHCAQELEQKIAKQKEVNSIKIDFVRSKFTIDIQDDKFDETLAKTKKIIKDFDPALELINLGVKPQKKSSKIRTAVDISLFLAGLTTLLITMFVKMPYWLELSLVIFAALLVGYKIYLKAIVLLFKEFTINENILVTISVFGAIALGEHMEALMVVMLYSIGKALESRSVEKSRENIENLMKMSPEFANIKTADGESLVAPDLVEVGSIIIVKPGERVPIDGVLVSGSGYIDTKHLTGESTPIYVSESKEILSGSIVLDGLFEIRTTAKYSDSTVSHIMNLIENASDKKSKTETVISKFSKYYTFVVVGLALTVGAITMMITHNVNDSVYKALVFLVISCPCAFAISVPLSYFSGIGAASKRGILIKGTNYLDAATKIDSMVFDKTGTLTTGKFSVNKIESFNKKFSKQDILKLAYLGEQNSIHPIAKAIVYEAKNMKTEQVADFKEIAGEGVEYTWNNNHYFVGKEQDTTNDSSTTIIIKQDGEKIGCITLSDTIKQESLELIKYLKQQKIHTTILSGDNEKATKSVAEYLGVDEYYSSMLPDDKYNWLLDKIKNKPNKKMNIAFVGDGINDSPSLMLSDVGISMGFAGSPATIEASNIVLVDDNPNKITNLINISKRTKKIVIENIAFAAITKVLFLILSASGVTGMLFAVFSDVGVTLLAILNSFRASKVKGEKLFNFSKHNNKKK